MCCRYDSPWCWFVAPAACVCVCLAAGFAWEQAWCIGTSGDQEIVEKIVDYKRRLVEGVRTRQYICQNGKILCKFGWRCDVRSAAPTPAHQPSPSPPLRSWGLDLAQPFMHIRSRRYRNGIAWRLPGTFCGEKNIPASGIHAFECSHPLVPYGSHQNRCVHTHPFCNWSLGGTYVHSDRLGKGRANVVGGCKGIHTQRPEQMDFFQQIMRSSLLNKHHRYHARKNR